MIVKAISIKEPWASMIANGQKTIEIRKWRTKYRGKIVLCASKVPKSELSGKAFALCSLEEIRPMKESDKKLSGGIYLKDHFTWILKDIKKINTFPVKGKMGIFEIDSTLKKSI